MGASGGPERGGVRSCEKIAGRCFEGRRVVGIAELRTVRCGYLGVGRGVIDKAIFV